MTESLRSVLLGTSVLSAALALALLLSLRRSTLSQDPAARDGVLRLLLLAIAVQCLHFGEEFVTGFHVRFPEMLGLSPWTPEFFVAFNLVWIAIWVISARALALGEGVRLALLPVWFLAIAAAANGIGHPVFALRAGGYFPGLFTSPLIGILGAALWLRLLALTRTR